MRRYHGQKQSISPTAARNLPVQPAPVAGGRPPPTRFKVERSIYEKKAPPQAYTVEAEFRKYVSSETSSEETDILRFWEVRSLPLISAQLTPLNRPTRLSSQHSSRSPWIISQSRQRPYPVSACSRQQRRQTPRSETRSAQSSWRPFNYSSFRSRKNASILWRGGQHPKWR
jgi:hypothetical protein